MPRSAAKKTGSARLAQVGKWHRRAGIASALVVVWLALTGVLLEHAHDLALDARHAGARWLLDWYGIRAPETVVGYRAGEAWVSQWGERIYFDERPLAREYGRLLGAVALSKEVVIAFEDQLVVLTPEGEPVETLGVAHGVPRGMRAIGLAGGHLVARTAHGDYGADEALLGWRAHRGPEADWARPSALPPDLRARLVDRYRGQVLTVERVLRDLHSGRLLGGFGVYLMDLAAAAFLVLAGSGPWLWFFRNNKARGSR